MKSFYVLLLSLAIFYRLNVDQTGLFDTALGRRLTAGPPGSPVTPAPSKTHGLQRISAGPPTSPVKPGPSKTHGLRRLSAGPPTSPVKPGPSKIIKKIY